MPDPEMLAPVRYVVGFMRSLDPVPIGEAFAMLSS
jgi:hypothetical protein